MDPLSEVLSLLKLKSYVSGTFDVEAGSGFAIAKYDGVKCYAPVSGSCWLTMGGTHTAIQIKAGDCVVLPRGLPFSLTAARFTPLGRLQRLTPKQAGNDGASEGTPAASLIGGHFHLTGSHDETLLSALPPIVHIHKQSAKETIRWSLERLTEELSTPQPGTALTAQQLAYVVLVQALRLHLQQEAAKGVGWLFALADPQIRLALTCMHSDPAHCWTLKELAQRAGMSRTVYAARFKTVVGTSSMQYLARWRMLLAGDRLKASDAPISDISTSVGYETESAFGKAFHKVWGHPPREHRQHP